MIVLLSAASAHANGSLLSLLADDVVPQISRPSWPVTVWVTSRSRTTAFCGDPDRCSVVPNRRILPVPFQAPLSCGIASWASAASGVMASINASAINVFILVLLLAFLFEHDLFRKPLHTPDQVRGRLFRDHALGIVSMTARGGGWKSFWCASRCLRWRASPPVSCRGCSAWAVASSAFRCSSTCCPC